MVLKWRATSNLFDTAFDTNFIKEKALLKHMNQFVLFLESMLYPKVRVSFGLGDLKRMILMLAIENVVVLLRRLQTMNCKHYSIKTHVKHKTNLHSNLE